MARIIALDSKPAGIACDNPKKPAVAELLAWAQKALAQGRTQIILPEIVDYEIRRKLLSLPDGAASIRRLDELAEHKGLDALNEPEKGLLVYAPINKEVMRRAARLWAEARKFGRPTAAENSIDADVILAAQALEYVGEGDQLWLATGNVKDLARYVGDRAVPWEAITP